MEKIMPLDLLSGIKGVAYSEAVNELFTIIKRSAPLNDENHLPGAGMIAASLDDLRNDEIIRCPEAEIELIKKNFPKGKNGFLVVPKVIED
jgi:Asp-tRNA(Asn)/Glu-tRNA(Gln) amidotransferase C subunit